MENNFNIVVLDGAPSNPGDLSWEELNKLGDVTVYPRTSKEETFARCLNADAVLTNKVIIDEELIRVLPRLKYIGVLATGYNVVDLKAADEAGIVVTNIPSYSTDSVAQAVFSLLLSATNHSEYYAQQNRLGRWAKSEDFCYTDYPLVELSGKKFGIIGYGNIGKAVAKIALAFGMNVKVSSSKPQSELPGVEKCDINTIFTDCDIVSLHCPLTENTFHLVDEQKLQLMKTSAILINTGRGPLVDEVAVAEALKDKRLYAFCADVLSQEPPAENNPLFKCPNAFITPHIAWATHEARKRLTDIAIGNLQAFLSCAPINVVNHPIYPI